MAGRSVGARVVVPAAGASWWSSRSRGGAVPAGASAGRSVTGAVSDSTVVTGDGNRVRR
ncbi:hypothetical protein [Saccharothrix algeriensis]|uniref:Uncharacterized protein n=1 Tax=Saccharothrix algeriensis TaxID=173560 RepID=A0ABS2S8K4_9PSEU|nr:hypothetical protein [Saccharothrix algeriensis]MBM7812548.1 hypothetical protein [Saccharothrix algeriensis]